MSVFFFSFSTEFPEFQNLRVQFKRRHNANSAMPSISDPTFTTFTRTQAQSYAQNRLSYPKELYETIIEYHTSTGGQLNVLADVGCGPGCATRDLAASFDYAIGFSDFMMDM